MAHHLTALILKNRYDENQANTYDLHGIDLGYDLTMFPIDHYYTACWQKIMNIEGCLPVQNGHPSLFPNEAVVSVLMSKISGLDEPMYAIIFSDYFGGIGKQWAHVYEGSQLADRYFPTINAALQVLGVTANEGMDEFDTVNLGKYRSQPDYLDKYVDLADELGV